MKQFYIFLLLLIITSSSCNNTDRQQFNASPTENSIPTENLSGLTKNSLDSLSRMLVIEYRMFDLPHFNKGNRSTGKEYAAIYGLTKEKSINFSFGIVFCTIGVDGIKALLEEDDIKQISLNQSEFKHALPCSFKDYLDVKIPTSDLFENYYKKCSETNDIKYFWEFQYALLAEAEYLLSLVPKYFLSNSNDEQYRSFVRKCRICREAIYILSKEDPFYASIIEYRKTQADRYGLECNKSFSTVSDAITGYPKYFKYFRNIRHQLLTL